MRYLPAQRPGGIAADSNAIAVYAGTNRASPESMRGRNGTRHCFKRLLKVDHPADFSPLDSNQQPAD
jgi:hypothetical protein